MAKTIVIGNRTVKFNPKYHRVDNRCRAGTGFKPDNPGRPLGTKSITTLLKEKLVNYALEMDFNETEQRDTYDIRGRVIKKYFRTIPKKQILSLAATLLPKEVTVKGMPETKVFTNIQIGKTETEIVDNLNARFMKQFSKETLPETTIPEGPA